MILFVVPFIPVPQHPVPVNIQELVFARPRYASPSYTLWGLGGGLFPSGGTPTRLNYYYVFTVPGLGGYQVGPGYQDVAVNAVVLVSLLGLVFALKRRSPRTHP